jgi:hypothetical protein
MATRREENPKFEIRNKSEARKRKEAKDAIAFQLWHNYIRIMTDLEFEWDPDKARINGKKHGVTFEEAVTVFMDERAYDFFDPDHSQEEDRFIMLGMSRRLRVLVVSYCTRQSGGIARIISARGRRTNLNVKSTGREECHYEKAL